MGIFNKRKLWKHTHAAHTHTVSHKGIYLYITEFILEIRKIVGVWVILSKGGVSFNSLSVLRVMDNA